MITKTNITQQKWYFTKNQIDPLNINWDSFEEVTIPHTWNALDGQDGGMDYDRGLFWYFTHLEINHNNQRKLLHFEGANSISTLYINGNVVGVHEGGYAGFTFDITDFVKVGKNDLAISVDNRHKDHIFPLYADFTFYGGIYRPVWLLYTDDVSFDRLTFGAQNVFIHQKKINHETALLDVEVNILNSGIEKKCDVEVVMTDAHGQVVIKQTQTIILNNKTQVLFEIKLGHPHLWQGKQDPYLYAVDVKIIDDKHIVDQVIIKTGLRDIDVDDTYLYLNGKQIRLNGVCRHQDYENIGNALSNEMHENDLMIIDEIGANAIRLAHYQQSDYMYQRCDELGFIVWAEIPYITVPSKTNFSGDNATLQLTELIMQNYNHPSIIMWGIQNEVTAVGKKYEVERIVTKLNQVAKQLDPYRLSTQAQLANVKVDDSLNQITDVSGFNLYYGWYFGKVEGFEDWFTDYRLKNPTRPVSISEYGVEGIIDYHSETPIMKDYTEEYHAKWHETAYSIFETKSYLWGSFVWNMFDFGSDGRDEGGIKGRNNKGLVTFDRKIKKDAFYFYQAKWSNLPVLHLCSKRFEERVKKDVVIKAYSNLGLLTFYHQGKLIKEVNQENVIYEVELSLVPGKNVITVESKDQKDTMILNHVEHLTKTYEVPVTDDRNVINWFNEVIKIHS